MATSVPVTSDICIVYFGDLLKSVSGLIKLIRPFQHYKVGIVFLPALFYGPLAMVQQAWSLAIVALAWMLAGSLVYVLNDMADLGSDRQRPDRADRPLVSGAVSMSQAGVTAGVMLALLLVVLSRVSLALGLNIGIYFFINLAYTAGLKKHLGLQQAIIAAGFWLRLQSGAAPVVPIPLTPWASLFTLGLAYYLNCLKGMHGRLGDSHRPLRFAMGMGAGLAGSLALAALVAICLKRSQEGSMSFPEFPPLFCLVGMHRTAARSFGDRSAKEQSASFFGDWVTVLAMVLFVMAFLYRGVR